MERTGGTRKGPLSSRKRVAEWLHEAEPGGSDSTSSDEPAQDVPPRKRHATVFMGTGSHRLELAAPRSGSFNDDGGSTEYPSEQTPTGGFDAGLSDAQSRYLPD